MNDSQSLLRRRCEMELKGQHINNFETPHYKVAHEDRIQLLSVVDMLTDTVSRLADKSHKLEEALKFYADEENYYTCHRKINSPVADGCGELARKTLKEILGK